MQLAAFTPSDGRTKAQGSRSPGPPPRTDGRRSDPHAREVVRLEEPTVP